MPGVPTQPHPRHRHRLTLAYDGSAYHGWQRQRPGLPTVQQAVEEALARVLGYPTHVHGCGRTDAGVHAERYVAHADLRAAPAFDLRERLNYALPPDVSVAEAALATPDFNAQHSARWRAYRYELDFAKDALRARRAWCLPAPPLHPAAMRRGVEAIAQASDFAALCRHPDHYPHTRCRIDACTLAARPDGSGLDFAIRADRFLHAMVRLLVARLVDVGTGRIALEGFESALLRQVPFSRKRAAPPQGLYLAGVGYDDYQLAPAPPPPLEPPPPEKLEPPPPL